MLAVTVNIVLHPGHHTAYLPMIRDNAHASLRDEGGCRRFDVALDDARPDEVFFHELYADRAAFDVHLETSHLQLFRDAAAPMIASPTVMAYDRVNP